MPRALVPTALVILTPLLGLSAEPNQRVPVLAELFTSEGCSTCPPADTFLMQLDKKQPVKKAQIIVLSEHVDYWNTQGWTDPFSSPQFSARQTAYNKTFRADNYTPQLVVDGCEHFVGSDVGGILAGISHAVARPKVPIRIASVQRDGSEAVVTVSVPAAPGDLWIAVADERDESSVKRGENSGRTLPHVAVVRHLEKVGSVSEGLEQQVRLPLSLGAQPIRIVAFVAVPNGRVIGSSMSVLAQ